MLSLGIDFWTSASGGVLGGAQAGNPLLAKDLFVGANNTALPSHTMDIGTGWTNRVGTMVLNGSSAVASGTTVSNEGLATFAAGVSDGLFKMTLTPWVSGANGCSPAMVFRYVDNNNYWLLQLAPVGSPLVQLYKKVAGTFTLVMSFPYALTSLVPHVVTLQLLGQTITFDVDGTNETSYTDPFNQTATTFGIRIGISGVPTASCTWSAMSLNQRSSARSWPVWTRYASNPIATYSGIASNWRETDLAAPDPFWDPVGNRWVIDISGFSATTGNWLTGLWYNSDITNLGGWVEEAANPVLNALDGAMRYWNGNYWYWGEQNGVHEGLNVYAWKSATLPNAGGWTIQNSGNPVMVPTPSTYDAAGIFDMTVQILADNSLVMYYGASASGGSTRTIAYATSTDGINWTKVGTIFSTILVDSDNSELGAIWVAPVGSTVQAPQYYFHDAKGNANYTSRYSDEVYFDGTTYHQRTLATVPIGTGWEKAQVFDVNALLVNGVWYKFYAGALLPGATQGLNASIGIMTAPYTG